MKIFRLCAESQGSNWIRAECGNRQSSCSKMKGGLTFRHLSDLGLITYNHFLLTYSSCSFPMEHRLLTPVHQSLLSLAFLSSCFHVSPLCMMHQVFLGRPLFLVPWGFHLRACLVLLALRFCSVWPIHPRLILLIPFSTGCWPVLCQRSLLLIVSGHLRQPLMNVCLYFRHCGLGCHPHLGSVK